MLPCNVPVRHGWAWIRAHWGCPERGSLSPEDLQLIERWRVDRLPFIVAACHETSVIRLGLSTRDKRRIGFSVQRREIARTAPPLALSGAIDAAPIAWRDSLRDIAEDSIRGGLSIHVYGSLAWTYRSNVSFLRPDSDVDLILVPHRASLSQIHSSVQALASRVGEPRLDGELLATTGAVSWREFAQCPDTLLVKTNVGPVIQTRLQFERALTKSFE